MKKIYAVLLAILALVSCAKESNMVLPEQEESVNTFTVQLPQTKTTISGTKMSWASGDKIKVFGYTDGSDLATAVYKIKSGAGSSEAVFELEDGESMGVYDEYYAIYPSSVGSSYSSSDGITVSTGLNVDKQSAVENGFDPAFALMTAKADGDGKLAFRHGVSYFKVTIPDDGVTKVKITFGKNAVQKRPYYVAADGTIGTNNGGTAIIAAEGSFVKGSSYYIAAIPNTANKMTSLNLAMTKGGVESSVSSTSSKLDAKIALGEVYDLGTPPISFVPVIKPVTPAKLEADATDGSFTYTVANPDGLSAVSAVKKSGDWITSVDDSVEGTISFTCTANTGDERTGVITLSYTGADDVDVTITQKAPSGPAESHVRVFYANSSKVAVELLDGAAVSPLSYFSTGGSGADLGGDYSISSWTIGDYTSTKGWKFNSSGYVSFTTSSTLNSTVRFYFIRRKSGDTTAQIQLLPEVGDATVIDSPHDAIGDSGVINLSKATNYTIKQKSKEQALLLVIVNESE